MYKHLLELLFISSSISGCDKFYGDFNMSCNFRLHVFLVFTLLFISLFVSGCDKFYGDFDLRCNF